VLDVESCKIATTELVFAWFKLIVDVAAGGAELVEDTDGCEEIVELAPPDDKDAEWADETDMLPTESDGPTWLWEADEFCTGEVTDEDDCTEDGAVCCEDEPTEDGIEIWDCELLLAAIWPEGPVTVDTDMLPTDNDGPGPLEEVGLRLLPELRIDVKDEEVAAEVAEPDGGATTVEDDVKEFDAGVKEALLVDGWIINLAALSAVFGDMAPMVAFKKHAPLKKTRPLQPVVMAQRSTHAWKETADCPVPGIFPEE
jgi:hypothetical protein